MKNTALAILFLFSISVFAQKNVATQEQIKTFFKTKTLVVLDESPFAEYNIEIKHAVTKSWKLTEFDFITPQEFEEKRKNPEFSFLTIDKVYFDKDKTQARYEFLCLSLGGKYKTTTDMPQLSTVPISYYGVDEETYVYKLNTLVNFTQNHILFTSENPKVTSTTVILHYNKNKESVKDKTLYLLKNELGPNVNTESKIKKVYPHKFKIVSREEIEKAIKEENDNIVFLHKVGPEGTKKKARCYNIIMGAKDAKLYYFEYHMISDKKPDGFLARDFKKLVK